LLLACTQNNPEIEEQCIRRLLARRIDGLFLSPVYRIGTEAPVYRELLASRVPTVLMGHMAPFCTQFVNVESDDVAGGYAVTQYLLAQGHKRISFFCGPPATPWSQERFEGYRRAMREANLELDEKLVFQGGRTIAEGALAAEQMLAEGTDATAVQVVNDLVATGCMDVLLKHGIAVPGDVSIAGFGNILFSEYCRVPLTTVSQPKYQLAVAAVQMMELLLQGKRPEPRRLPTNLVIRSSTGTAPAARMLKRP
jgi:LacI family transcriptional regulator